MRSGASTARSAADAARVSRAVVHAAAVSTDLALLVIAAEADADGGQVRVRWGNAGTEKLFGHAAGDLPGMALDRLFPVPPPGGFGGWLRRERSTVAELSARSGTGVPVDLHVTATPSSDTGVWTLSAQPARSATERALAESAAAHERRFTTLTERSPVPTLLSEQGMRLAHVNDAFCRLVDRQAEELLGTGWLSVVHSEDLDAVLDAAADALVGGASDVRARLLRGAGDVRTTVLRLSHLHTPALGSGFVATIEDVTERLAFQSQLEHQATHDPLTGLPNRTRLTGFVAERFVAGAAGRLSCLFLDVDDFKVVNDSLGHAAGDQLLVQVAQRLRSVVRPSDLVVRFGGDEFVVVCEDLSEAGAVVLGERISAELARPVQLGGVGVGVRVSVGVTVQTADHADADELVRDCDIAMYQAKAGGKGRVSVLDQGARGRARDKLQLVADLRAALDDGAVALAYQPLVDAGSGRPVGVEALARWTHPVRGAIGPDVFVPLAEESGLIDALGAFVVEEACRQIARWDAELGLLAPRVVHVNVSALQLDEHLPELVARTAREHGVGIERICVELTESALMRDPDGAPHVLERLRGLGVSIAIDDFGTGYSSLALLRQLPVDCLKIDRSFVSELAEGHPEITRAVAALAAGLGLSSVAEGVETEDQARVLRELGVTHLQGYGVARPMPGAACATWFAGRAR
ncbi:diguanylate cyclase/phosphodiesterase with PAS/PAC sensor(s) [Klenkia marina]|uniref:Diguanylate cyclase/phosphodiesterase with PAS/PAC sensor(S) n=1 Tax=Klenkia marina TaxID=1960309 RepID=A0A1G4YQ12_9ACTN|nr:bifunctional diguanylate cyclase/phosphodiesterase [Klenkia marina]SCX55550.1 diguanylate cyclase/phosphodiesterase with PAS/PAC sensor(s) [Klenkia marina]